jgi:hypothetical protein
MPCRVDCPIGLRLPSAARTRLRHRKGEHKEGLQSMFPTAGLDVKMRRETIRGAAATPDDISGRFYANRAKPLVMTYIGQFVSDGFAERRVLENGDVELRFFTGEAFLLADATITRIL